MTMKYHLHIPSFYSISSDEVDFPGKIEYKDNPFLNIRLRALCSEFKDTFSTSLSPEPVNLSPFSIDVSLADWEVPQTHQPPRVQSSAKNVEINKTTGFTPKIRNNPFIRSTNRLQVLLAVKPHTNKTEWCFCIDYRRLNALTKAHFWSLPNTKHMFERIGSHRGRYFAVMDFTQGLHQLAFAELAIPLTTFITFCGVYEFFWVPFDPKSAPSYF